MISMLQHGRKLSAREREVRLVGWALGFLFFRQMKEQMICREVSTKTRSTTCPSHKKGLLMSTSMTTALAFPYNLSCE